MSEAVIQPLTELTPAYRALVESASAALMTAYAPYSRFHVGATLLFADGSRQFATMANAVNSTLKARFQTKV